MLITLTWDDGALEDHKLFELHEKYKIPGMFFVPTRNACGRDVLSPNEIRNARSEMISFGGHTDNHAYLTEIDQKLVEPEIVNNKKYLEDVLGEEIYHFCPPRGRYNDYVLDTIYKYYRTVRTADIMNFSNHSALLKPSFQIFERTYHSLVGNCVRNKSFNQLIPILIHPQWKVMDLIINLITIMSQNDNYEIIIWGHSWEIESNGLWGDLEKIFMFLSEKHKEECVSYDRFESIIEKRST